jgi:hypothetical protein
MRCAAEAPAARLVFEVADIVRDFGEAYRHLYTLTPDQAEALRVIDACRTAATFRNRRTIRVAIDTVRNAKALRRAHGSRSVRSASFRWGTSILSLRCPTSSIGWPHFGARRPSEAFARRTVVCLSQPCASRAGESLLVSRCAKWPFTMARNTQAATAPMVPCGAIRDLTSAVVHRQEKARLRHSELVGVEGVGENRSTQAP